MERNVQRHKEHIMTNWIYRINLRRILNEETEETPQAVLKKAEEIRDEINKSRCARLFVNLPYKLVERTKKAVDAGFDYYEVRDIFNGILSRIYDIADEER